MSEECVKRHLRGASPHRAKVRGTVGLATKGIVLIGIAVVRVIW